MTIAPLDGLHSSSSEQNHLPFKLLFHSGMPQTRYFVLARDTPARYDRTK